MEILGILLPFLLLGIGVLFVAFSGGPGQAREVYLTRGSPLFRFVVPVVCVVGGLIVPALVLVNRVASAGATEQLAGEELTEEEAEGKSLFSDNCATCHNLDALNARGVTGPDLDEIGAMSKQRVLSAIERGGTGQKRMPAGILDGHTAEAVAAYVEKVAGK